MSTKPVRISVLALLLAVVAAFSTTPGSWSLFRFKIGNYDREGETESIGQTIQLFSATLAGLYLTVGNSPGLNIFPATNLIKRRILQEIRTNLDSGVVLAVDRDRSDVRQVLFSDSSHATAVVDEAWYMQYQDPASRRPVASKKANFITVRYYLKKMWGRWTVMDYEVYGRDDSIPPVQHERFVQW